MISINNSLVLAIKQLTEHSDTARLDAEILLCHVLKCSRSTLRAHPERPLTPEQQFVFQQLIQRRLKGEPIAYIIGHREFWSLDLRVTPDTLIPRPATESLVSTVLEKLSATASLCVADLGTGSGAIALALSKERPHWHILATDNNSSALAIARENAALQKCANITFYRGDWCYALPKNCQCDAIVSNPPYIAENDPHLHQGDVRFEPQFALTAGADGLHDIKKIINQARIYLKVGGWLFMEHGYDQSDEVRALMQEKGYLNIVDTKDLAGQPRVVSGQYFAL